ncbi:MAG: hypothetical protein UT05_C0002G0022 [Parcubacteria group bacterium GW2011_GWF2_38_76]|nr:MAG: hypothetical protein UT05_C0002G0022 [Parcubacteria group bacterium GW2011_GWF2_38_76]HBM45820.1 hypothetical protein [Patescibacteria group bacterium]
MSKELKNIGDEVMAKIREGQVKMKPKYYFIVGSVLSFVGLVSSLITSVFLIALTRFAFRSHGGIFAEYRFEQLVSNFPWWAPILAVVSLFIGIKLIRRYDFSYKKNFVYVVIWLVLAVFMAGLVFDMTGLNDIWLQHGPMKGIMRQYFDEGGVRSGLGQKHLQANISRGIKLPFLKD